MCGGRSGSRFSALFSAPALARRCRAWHRLRVESMSAMPGACTSASRHPAPALHPGRPRQKWQAMPEYDLPLRWAAPIKAQND